MYIVHNYTESSLCGSAIETLLFCKYVTTFPGQFTNTIWVMTQFVAMVLAPFVLIYYSSISILRVAIMQLVYIIYIMVLREPVCCTEWIPEILPNRRNIYMWKKGSHIEMSWCVLLGHVTCWGLVLCQQRCVVVDYCQLMCFASSDFMISFHQWFSCTMVCICTHMCCQDFLMH